MLCMCDPCLNIFGLFGLNRFEETTGVKEFLFSLPRFARDEKDKLKKERYSDIGTIKVTCWKAEFQGHEMYVRVQVLLILHHTVLHHLLYTCPIFISMHANCCDHGG